LSSLYLLFVLFLFVTRFASARDLQPLPLSTKMEATAAARRLAAVNRHLGGGSGEAAAGEATEQQQHSTSSSGALLLPPMIISPSAVSAAPRQVSFRADRLLDGQVRKGAI